MDESVEPIPMDYDEELTCPVCYMLLVDPTTLTCGHTLCRLCLARWYNVSKKKECSLCRQPWEGQPQVNMTLRNLIEKMHYQQLQVREQNLRQDPENIVYLKEFDKNMALKNIQPKKAELSSFLTGIFVTLGAVLVIYLLNFWQSFGGHDQLVNKPVAFWQTSEVIKWLSGMPWANNYSLNAQTIGIDGHMLLGTNDTELLELLNVTDTAHQNILLMAIHSLRRTGVKMPTTLWEYKALYPGRSLFLVFALREFPRSTMLLNYFFYYEESFLPFLYTTTPFNAGNSSNFMKKLPDPTVFDLVSFWIFMLAMPYYMLGFFAWNMRSVHAYTPWFVMTSCALLMLLDGAFYSELVTQQKWRNWPLYLKLHIKDMVTTGMFMILWPVTPTFVCDLLFYGTLYLTPLDALKSVWQRIHA